LFLIRIPVFTLLLASIRFPARAFSQAVLGVPVSALALASVPVLVLILAQASVPALARTRVARASVLIPVSARITMMPTKLKLI
jgi:hypothetical protein